MPVTHLNPIILFVANPQASAQFYSRILGIEPIEQSPTFVMFALPHGSMLALWSKFTAEPFVTVGGGGCEISFVESDVDAIYQEWLALGIPVAQVPTDMDFGRTFVALDPDGHRIRIYCPSKEA